jgi:hypothetical protein
MEKELSQIIISKEKVIEDISSTLQKIRDWMKKIGNLLKISSTVLVNVIDMRLMTFSEKLIVVPID